MPERKDDPAIEKKEGGPLERKRAFMRQRGAVLRPREESSDRRADEKPAPKPGSSRPGKKQS